MARERGASGLIYLLARLALVPLLRLYFRVRISGAEHIPKRGAAIIAANHKDFWDAFFIALATKRHVRFMTASETMCGTPGSLCSFVSGRSRSDAASLTRTPSRQPA